MVYFAARCLRSFLLSHIAWFAYSCLLCLFIVYCCFLFVLILLSVSYLVLVAVVLSFVACYCLLPVHFCHLLWFVVDYIVVLLYINDSNCIATLNLLLGACSCIQMLLNFLPSVAYYDCLMLLSIAYH